MFDIFDDCLLVHKSVWVRHASTGQAKRKEEPGSSLSLVDGCWNISQHHVWSTRLFVVGIVTNYHEMACLFSIRVPWVKPCVPCFPELEILCVKTLAHSCSKLQGSLS